MNKKENFLRAVRRENPEWVPNNYEAAARISCPVVERPTNAGRDDFGVLWNFSPEAEGGTYPSETELVVTDIEHWREQVIFPDLKKINWESVRDEVSKIDREEFLVEGFCEMGLFERSYLLLGMEEALMAYYTHPEEMYALCSAIADYKIDLLRRYHAASGMDMIWYGDDWGTQQNLFVSPVIWRKIIKPNTKRIYDCLKELGIIINQHSCGWIESILPDLCEMGTDIWNPCQPCNNLAEMKKRYGGEISFWGGVDSQFILDNPAATPEDVRIEVRKRIDKMALPAGGYILGPSHSVPYEPAKLHAMKTEASEYGCAVYQKNK